MRNTFAEQITKIAKKDKDVVLLSGDIGNRMFDSFKEYDFKRFINCGIAEGNMMSVACGLALTAMKPYVYTITPFTTTRCLEQIKIGAAYHNSNVTIIGTGSGLSYAELGPTHHSLEDMGILNCIPNLRILAPCDSIELRHRLIQINNLRGPTYIRIGKKGEPDLLNKHSKVVVGKANILRDGNEILLLGIGPILKEAIDAADILSKEHGIEISVVSLGGISPIDKTFLQSMVGRGFKRWVTLEEHGLSGGLASTINNWLISSQSEYAFKVLNIFTENKFINNLGNQKYVRNKLGLDCEGIISRILEWF